MGCRLERVEERVEGIVSFGPATSEHERARHGGNGFAYLEEQYGAV